MAVGSERAGRAAAEPTVIPSCTERDFFETMHRYDRRGTWFCVYCGEPIEYTAEGRVYVGAARLA
jgi:hypothetical protein